MMMKKVLMGLIVIGVAGLMVYTLFNNKAKADLKAKNANRQVSIPVITMTVQRQDLQSTFSKTGTIVANNEASVISQASGKVIAVYANVGTYVKAGTPLCKVEDTVLSSRLASARTAYGVALKEWERANKLHQGEIISDSELETYVQTLETNKANLASARKDYDNSLITAPISGIVTDRVIDLGTTISTGTAIATVVDNSNYKVTVNVAEAQAFKLKTGGMVTIETAVYPDARLRGHIKSISAKSDSVHTFPVEVTIENDADHPLKSGVFGKLIFNRGNAADVLAIPREALVGSIKTPQVYVVENGHAILRSIVVDSEVNTYLVVKSGLKENEQLVVNGQENLNNNDSVKIINQGNQK
jgi:RND family efflux transporter MFP subunit